jgi:branched-chain amino acid transport system permease protein
METVLTLLINWLVTSSMYLLVALGFALLLSIMGIFNFAHGAIYMLGAFLTWALAVQMGINLWAATVLSVVLMGVLGLAIERFCFRPFGGNQNNVMVISIAMIMIFETTVSVTLGGFTRSLPPYISGVLKTEFFSVSYQRLATVLVGAILLTAMFLFIRKSRTGKQMLAVSQNREGAALLGIDINRISGIAVAVACAMASLAGSLMASLLSLTPTMGDNMLTKAIEVVILTGIGSIGGTLAGGLIIGAIDGVLPVFTSGAIADGIGLAIIMIILLIRPKGLFGYEIF